MHWVADALRDNPELALFLTLALGFALGRIRIGSFELGPVVGCLFAGVVVGQLGTPVSQPLKNAFFLLGVCCGAGTSAPALAAVEEVADSKVPALGYGVGCALGNVILALWGTVVVLLIGG